MNNSGIVRGKRCPYYIVHVTCGMLTAYMSGTCDVNEMCGECALERMCSQNTRARTSHVDVLSSESAPTAVRPQAAWGRHGYEE